MPRTSFAANRYWVGEAGANINVTSSWSTTSGGAPGASVPGSADVAIFDGGGNTDATISSNWTIHALSITSDYSATITQNSGTTLRINQNFTNNSTPTVFTSAGVVTFYRTNISTSVTSGGVSFNNVNLYAHDNGGTWTTTFHDNLIVLGNLTVRKISGDQGHNWTASTPITIFAHGNVDIDMIINWGTFGLANITVRMVGDNKNFLLTNGRFNAHLNLNGTGTTTVSRAGSTTGGTTTINQQSGIVALSGHGNFWHLTIASGRVLDVSPDDGVTAFNITVRGNFVNNAGENGFVARGRTFTHRTDNTSATFNHNGIQFHHLNLTSWDNSGTFTTTFNTDLVILGNLTVRKLSSHQGHNWTASTPITIFAHGNVDMDLILNNWGTFGLANITVRMVGDNKNFIFTRGRFNAHLDFNGTGTTLVSKAGDTTAGTTTINQDTGSVTLSANSLFHALNVLNGTLSLDSRSLTVNNTFNIREAGVLQLNGNESISKCPTSASGSTVNYVGTALASYNLKACGYSNLALNGNTDTVFVSPTTLTANYLINNSVLRLIGSETVNINNATPSGTIRYIGNGNSLPNTYFIKTNIPYHNLEIAGIDQDDEFVFPSTPIVSTLPGLVAWFDANSLSGSNGTAIATWVNQASGYGNATQGTSSRRPLLYNNIINGNKILRFDGNDDHLFLGTIRSAEGPVRAFVVSQRSSGQLGGDPWQRIISSWSGVSGQNDYQGNGWNVGGAWDGSGNSLAYEPSIRGRSRASGAVINRFTIGAYAVSSLNSSFRGDLAEIIVFDRELSTDEVNLVNIYLGNKYNISPHAGQKYSTIPLLITGSFSHISGGLDLSSADLILSGTDQTISLFATTTVNSLTKTSSTTDSTLYFDNSESSPLIVNATSTLQATDSGTLTLASVSPGTHWYFNPTGERIFENFTVSDSYNLGEIIETIGFNIFDDGNNVNWAFGGNANIFIGTNSEQYDSINSLPVTDQGLGGSFYVTVRGGSTNLEGLTLNYAGSVDVSNLSNLEIHHYTLPDISDTCPQAKPVSASLYSTLSDIATSTASFTGDLSLESDTKTCLYLYYDLNINYDQSLIGRDIDFYLVSPREDFVFSSGEIRTTRTRLTIPKRTIIVDPNQNFSFISFQMPDPDKNPTLYYVRDGGLYKKEGDQPERLLHNQNLKAHFINFTGDRTSNSAYIRYEYDLGLTDDDNPDNFLNVVRGYLNSERMGNYLKWGW